jgi:hypothetical protein
MADIQFSRFANDKTSGYPIKTYGEAWYYKTTKGVDWPKKPISPLYPGKEDAQNVSSLGKTVDEIDVSVTLTLLDKGVKTDVTRTKKALSIPGKKEIEAIDVVFQGILNDGSWAVQVTMCRKYDPKTGKASECYSEAITLK